MAQKLVLMEFRLPNAIEWFMILKVPENLNWHELKAIHEQVLAELEKANPSDPDKFLAELLRKHIPDAEILDFTLIF